MLNSLFTLSQHPGYAWHKCLLTKQMNEQVASSARPPLPGGQSPRRHQDQNKLSDLQVNDKQLEALSPGTREQQLHSFTHSFKKFLLSHWYGPEAMLATVDIRQSKSCLCPPGTDLMVTTHVTQDNPWDDKGRIPSQDQEAVRESFHEERAYKGWLEVFHQVKGKRGRGQEQSENERVHVT